MSTQRKLQSFFKNYVWVKGRKKYLVTMLIFLSWMLFFDRYTIDKTMSLNDTITALERSKERHELEIKKAIRDKKNLEDNSERFAREKYLMHKTDEDVFIIENKQ